MKPSKLDIWVKRILATEDEEISCSDCFDLLSEYVDVEISRRPVPVEYGKLKQHLFQCQVCHEEYELLRNLAQMDADKQEFPPEK